jgi:two-component system, LytTR family, response regulator
VKIRTLIVDDEPLARSRIRNLLSKESDVELAGECENGFEAIEAIDQMEPDLVFLDVQMPGVNGFGVLERIGVGRMPLTVFVTAYDEFALRAFEAHALDYLLKPFEADRLRQALGRAREHLALRKRKHLEQRLEALLAEMDSGPEYLERFLVRVGSRIQFVEADRVDWIGAEGNYLRLHVADRSFLVRETVAGVEAKLNPKKFLRIHRSTIVNLERVRAVESLYRGEYVLILKDGTKLSTSAAHRDRLESVLLRS